MLQREAQARVPLGAATRVRPRARPSSYSGLKTVNVPSACAIRGLTRLRPQRLAGRRPGTSRGGGSRCRSRRGGWSLARARLQRRPGRPAGGQRNDLLGPGGTVDRSRIAVGVGTGRCPPYSGPSTMTCEPGGIDVTVTIRRRVGAVDGPGACRLPVPLGQRRRDGASATESPAEASSPRSPPPTSARRADFRTIGGSPVVSTIGSRSNQLQPAVARRRQTENDYPTR